MRTNLSAELDAVCADIIEYLLRCQDFTAGEYYGSFWSEKAYHGPVLDYHAGGAHHNRGAGTGGLALWLSGKEAGDRDRMYRAEQAFDWLATRQRPSGGYFEVQNNEKPSDWERTGLPEASTIATAFVAHGLASAILAGLPPKASYAQCLKQMGHWFLSIEYPPGSGIFPHHERSPYDTLNANLHAAESLALIHMALRDVYGVPLNLFLQGAGRAIRHTLTLQWDNGCFPYRDYGHVTINYTSLVVWCLQNVLDALPENLWSMPHWAAEDECRVAVDRAAAFLCTCVAPDGELLWDGNETSTAKHNTWTYGLTASVLSRAGDEQSRGTAARLLRFLLSQRTSSGLLRMRDCGEDITECAYKQADVFLFLQDVLSAAI